MLKSFDRVREVVQPEFKSLLMEAKAIDGRTVTTLFSVAGNEDSVGDIVYPGAFQQTIAARGAKVFHLFMHDSMSPPIAIVKGLREVGREALPPSVMAEFPEAQGGTEADSEFLDDPRSDGIFRAIKAGAPFQASFAFDAIRFDFSDEGRVRNLRELRLWEISTVLWGANAATLGSKALVDLDLICKQLVSQIAAIKSGARHSAADIKALNSIHHAVVDLGTTVCKDKLDAEEPEPEEDPAKASRAAQALTQLKADLTGLELYLLAT